MNPNFGHQARWRPALLASLLSLIVSQFAGLRTIAATERAPSTHAIAIMETNDAVECQLDGETLWRYFFTTNKSKPGFYPLRVAGGESLAALQPSDHVWHYGLWFSWKYINGVNYWEERNGHPEGVTKWEKPKITAHKDGSAEIKMNLSYVSPANEVMMTEKRDIKISRPGPDGGVTIDWTGKFTAGKTPLLLDRTPMPNEPKGQVNGGYAGFSMRTTQSPAVCEFVTTHGPVTKFESDRARPNSKAAACNVTLDGRTDGVAILSATSNLGGESPWYIVNSKSMHWFSPVQLAPAPKKVKPRETFTWKFRVITRAGKWTPEMLEAAADKYE